MHITISGHLGSGKSTVAKMFAKRNNFIYFSTGTIMRRMAQEMNIDVLELNKLSFSDPKYDKLIDDGVVEFAKQHKDENVIFDSRMAWHFVPGAVKIYLTVCEDAAAKRVFGDTLRGEVEKYKDAEHAKKSLYARLEEEKKRYKHIYGVDVSDLSNYQYVIDTSLLSVEEVCVEIEKKVI